MTYLSILHRCFINAGKINAVIHYLIHLREKWNFHRILIYLLFITNINNKIIIYHNIPIILTVQFILTKYVQNIT